MAQLSATDIPIVVKEGDSRKGASVMIILWPWGEQTHLAVKRVMVAGSLGGVMVSWLLRMQACGLKWCTVCNIPYLYHTLTPLNVTWVLLYACWTYHVYV